MSRNSNEIALNVSAPAFECTDIYGRTIRLSDYRGKRMLIGFFRHAGCPFCNLRVHALKKLREDVQSANFDMIFFFESGSRLLKASTFHQEVSPIPLIADPEKIWYQTYGVESSFGKSMASHLTTFIQTAIKATREKVPMHIQRDGESFSTMPAEFLVDEDLILRKLHYSSGLTDRMSLQHILDFAQKK